MPLSATLAENAVKLALADLQDLTGILPPPIPLLERGQNDQEALKFKELVKPTAFDMRELIRTPTPCSAEHNDQPTGCSVARLTTMCDGAYWRPAGAMLQGLTADFADAPKLELTASPTALTKSTSPVAWTLVAPARCV